MGLEALPQSRNVLVGVEGILSAEARNQQQPALLDARRRQGRDRTFIHFDCLHQIDVIEMALRPNRFGGDPELVAKRSGESLVGAVTEIQSDGQDVWATVRKHPRRLAQSPAAHVAHCGLAGRRREHMSEVVARYSSGLRQFV
jgi:hypothetical protein